MDKYQEYLEIMNLNQNYSIDELKNSYKTLIKKYHPDKYEGNELRELAEEKLKKVNEAYSFLKERLENSYSNQSMQEDELMYKTFEVISIRLKEDIEPLLEKIYDYIDNTLAEKRDFRELDFEYLTEIYSIISKKVINLFLNSLPIISIIREEDLEFYRQNILEVERGSKELYETEKGDSFFRLLRDKNIEIKREDYLLIVFYKYNLFTESMVSLTTEMRNKFLNFENAINLTSMDSDRLSDEIRKIYVAKTLLWDIKRFLDEFNNIVLCSFGEVFYILDNFFDIKERLEEMKFINVIEVEDYSEISKRILSFEEEREYFAKIIEKFDNFVENDYTIQTVKKFLKNNIFSENRIYSNDILINRIDEILLRTLKVFIDNIMEISVKKECEKRVYDKKARYEFEKDKVKRDFIDIYLKGTNVDEELIDIICFELQCIENIKFKFNGIKYMIKDFLSTKSKNQIENESYLKKEIDNVENIVRDYMERALFFKNSSVKIEYIRNPEKINTDPYIFFSLSNYRNSEDFSTYSKEKLEELIELFPNEKEANLFIKLYIEMNYSKNSENLRSILREIVEIPEDKIFDNRYAYLLLNKVIDLSSYEYFRLSHSDFLTCMKFVIDPDTRKKIMIKFKEIKELYSYTTDYDDLIKKGSEYKRKVWGEDKYHINDVEEFSEKFYMYFERNLKNYFSIEENQEIQKFIKDCEEEEETLKKYSNFIYEKIYENKKMKKLINAANFILLNLYDKPFSFEKEYQNIKNEDNKEILEEKLKKFKDYYEKVRDFKEIIKYEKYEKEDLNIILNQLKERVKKSEISKTKQNILVSHEQENISRLIRDLKEKSKNAKDKKIEMKIEILNKVIDYYSILKSI
jgi:molecular chaperone, dnaJ family (contain C-term. Zn finger domain)